jgi:hypothetical protein
MRIDLSALACLTAAMLLTSCAETRSRTASTTTPAAITVSAAPGVIPAGTSLEIRTNESINTKSTAEGRTYSAEIATDVVSADGNVLISRGSPAQLVVMQVTEARGVRGGPGLEVGLQSVTVNGQRYLVSSADVDRERGLGKNERTAKMVGGGAALGALIGAIAGGGSGAAIGGAVGAAAGAGAQVLTQGDEIRIPAETVLQFKLDEPLSLQTS